VSGLRIPAVTLAILLMTIAASPLLPGQPMGEARAETVEKTIDKDHYWPYEFRAKATDILKVTAKEASGHIFDLFLMEEYMVENYEEALANSGNIIYIEDHSRLGTLNMSYSKTMPNPGGKYAILIDNTEAPDEDVGGSYANATLNITLTVKIEEASPGAGVLLSGLAVLATGVIMAMRRRRA